MAEMHADRYGQAEWSRPEHVNPVTKFTYAIGSLISIGLIVGFAFWGYQLLVRDVSGVPVIKAAEGPMRVQPEDPGGRQAINQGLSVNDVAAIGAAAATPDELILAPAPLDLSDEDAPGTWVTTTQAEPTRLDAPADPEVVSDAAPLDEAAILALADTLAAGVEPLAAPAPDEALTIVPGGLGRSLRPKMRPATLSLTETVAASAPADSSSDIDAASIPTGTRLAQLVAFKTEEIARTEWTRLEGKFEEYLTGKNLFIERAESGGRTFYRLRAMGFDDLADARRFCSALVAEQAECIPVVTR